MTGTIPATLSQLTNLVYVTQLPSRQHVHRVPACGCCCCVRNPGVALATICEPCASACACCTYDHPALSALPLHSHCTPTVLHAVVHRDRREFNAGDNALTGTIPVGVSGMTALRWVGPWVSHRRHPAPSLGLSWSCCAVVRVLATQPLGHWRRFERRLV